MKKPIVVLTRAENNLSQIQKSHSQVQWMEFPLITFEYQEIQDSVLDEIKDSCDWLIFTSQNGAKSFFQQVDDVHACKIACVGPKTANVVRDFGHTVEFIPSHFTSMILAREIPITSSDCVFYIGGNLSSKETLHKLEERAGKFQCVEAYHTVHAHHSYQEWEKLAEVAPSIISFCSPSAVRSFIEQVAEHKVLFSEQIRFAAIGNTTAAAILEHLSDHVIIGEKHTLDGMLDAIIHDLNMA